MTLASAEERTTEASISSPLSRATPVALPFLTTIRATGASVRISAPSACAARAIE